MIYASEDGLKFCSRSDPKPTRSQMQANANETFKKLYTYIENYGSELREISIELGRSPDDNHAVPSVRKSWNDYREEQKRNNRFYQGEYVYFNPDDLARTDKNVDYYAVNRVIRILKECGYTQADISAVCNVSTAIVSGWMTGREKYVKENGREKLVVQVKDAIKDNFEYHPNIHPDKYQWWAIAIEICLPATLLDPFLMMVGAVFEPFRMEDQIIYGLMRPNPKTPFDPSKHSGANVQSELSKNDLNSKLCQEALLAFHLMKRSDLDKTKGKKD